MGAQALPLKTAKNIRWGFVNILALYATVVAGLGLADKYSLHYDSTYYYRLAEHLAQGRFSYCVQGHWAPLLIFCLAPFFELGLDPLVSGKIVMGLWGALFVVSMWFFSKRFELPDRRMKYVMMAAVCMQIAVWTSQLVTPDILVATLLTFYFFAVTSERVVGSYKRGALCGAIGGIAYLAKHYAFPFFIVHFPTTLILHVFFAQGARPGWKKVFMSLSAGMGTFFIIALVWAVPLSAKYHRLLFNTSGQYVYQLQGPLHSDGKMRLPGVHTPEGLQQSINEDLTNMLMYPWNPFESRQCMTHQINIMFGNLTACMGHLRNNGGVFAIFAVFFLPVLLWHFRQNRGKAFLYSWALMTIAVFSGGYLITFAEYERYFWPILLWPCVIAFHIVFMRDDNAFVQRKGIYPAVVFWATILFFSFAAKPLKYSIQSFPKIFKPQENAFRKIAQAIEPYTDNFADIDLTWGGLIGGPVSYYLKGKKYCGRPRSEEINGITQELLSAGVSSLIVVDSGNELKPIIIEELEKSKSYKLLLCLDKKKLPPFINKDIRVFRLKNAGVQQNAEGGALSHG